MTCFAVAALILFGGYAVGRRHTLRKASRTAARVPNLYLHARPSSRHVPTLSIFELSHCLVLLGASLARHVGCFCAQATMASPVAPAPLDMAAEKAIAAKLAAMEA